MHYWFDFSAESKRQNKFILKASKRWLISLMEIVMNRSKTAVILLGTPKKTMEAQSENLSTHLPSTRQKPYSCCKASSVVTLTCNSSLCRTFGGCHSSPLPMPIILYDGSEEELMDTIEREFSWLSWAHLPLPCSFVPTSWVAGGIVWKKTKTQNTSTREPGFLL